METERPPLRQRLALLRRQNGCGAPGSPRQVTLAERLDRLRPARPGAPGRPSDAELAGLLRGRCLTPGLIVVERLFPLSHRHGDYLLSELSSWRTQSRGGHVAAAQAGDVFLDTETTGLAGGTGTLVFLIGLARLEPPGLRVRQLFVTTFGGEPHLLETAREWLGHAQRVVTFNGKCFDAPLLAARYRLAGMSDPLSGLPHADLLYPVRRAFASRWPDCRLQTAEALLLRFLRAGDLPSWQVPEAWFDWVRRGATQLLPGVVEHNCWDLVSLATLLPVLAAVYTRPGEAQADLCAIARGHLREGKPDAAYGCLCAHAADLDAPGRLLLARLHCSRDAWEAAAAIWEALAVSGNPDALLCLAKYHEHRRRDPGTALDLAQRLVSLEPHQAVHRHRVTRLERKLAAGG